MEVISHMHAHTYIHAYTHTYTHTYIHTGGASCMLKLRLMLFGKIHGSDIVTSEGGRLEGDN